MFDCDEAKRRSNLKKHGVGFVDVLPASGLGPTVGYDDRTDHGEKRYICSAGSGRRRCTRRAPCGGRHQNHTRTRVSPLARTLGGEALECALEPGTRLTCDEPPRPKLEHHLLLMGRLEISVGRQTHDLRVGDCLRHQLFGPSALATPDDCGARFVLFVL